MTTVPAGPSDLPGELDLLELAQAQYQHTQDIINFADTKAHLTLAADALLASVLVGIDPDLARSLLHPATPTAHRVAIILLILMFLALIVSVYFAVRVARPRLRVTKGHSLFYFGHVVQHSETEFISRFMHMGERDALAALLSQVYARSLIAQRKFTGITRSLDFLVAAVTLWALAQVLLLVG